MYIYVTETEKLADYGTETLFWLEEELEYGDWTGGPTGDGVFEKSGQIDISEVNVQFFLSLVFWKNYPRK